VTVTYEAADGVAVLTLDRPGKLNAVTTAMSERLFGLIDEIGTNDEVRAVVLTGDPVDAAEALRIGLVSRLYSPDSLVAARSLALTIASRPPVAAQAAKANLLAARSMGLEQAIQYEREMQAICMGTRDAAEGRSAFAEKRVPKFTGH